MRVWGQHGGFDLKGVTPKNYFQASMGENKKIAIFGFFIK